MNSDAGNGIDCVTTERVAYLAGGPTAISAPSGSIHPLRDPNYYQDFFGAPAGTQWQTHDPDKGARVGLASGAPMAIDAGGFVVPLGAGSSFYRQLNTVTDADQGMLTQYHATANTDTLLASYMRYVDSNNNIRLEYIPATTTWNVVERIAGVDNILDTVIFDLGAVTNAAVRLDAVGNQISVPVNAIGLAGAPYTTVHLSPGPTAYLVIATGAGVTGYGAVQAFNL